MDKIRANSSVEYCLQMGAMNVSKHAAMSIAAIAVTTASLLLLAIMHIMLVNTRMNMQQFQAENAILAFINESYSTEQAKRLSTELAKIPGVKNVQFITRDEAYESYISRYEASVSKYLSPAIFRDRCAVELSPHASIATVKEAVLNIPGIDEVRSDEAITNGFNTARKLIGIIGIVGISIMLFVSTFIIINTVKLTMISRKEEYAVMKMMGAYDSFLQLPLLSEGAIVGGFSAIIAFIVSSVIYIIMANVMSDAGVLTLITLVPMSSVAMPMFILLLLIGMGIGIGGSLIAIKKYLNV